MASLPVLAERYNLTDWFTTAAFLGSPIEGNFHLLLRRGQKLAFYAKYP
jgi:hypothetical protein